MAQSHVLPLMERAKPVNISHVSYLLTDNTGLFSFSANKPVWAGGPYSLWKELNKNWILVSIQRNANGIEVWGGERAFWMGQGDTELMILAPRAGRAVIRAWFTPGPSLPDKPDRRILIRTKGYEAQFTITKDGPDSFTVPVIEGMNRVFLRALDKPTLAVLPSGEARPLLIGVRGLKTSLVN